MPVCPQCTKPLPELTKRCPSCMADLDLLVEYVNQLEKGLERADLATRAGQLDEAVWAYLAVLEVDPDNATARRQVGRVATAVRQFDRTVPGRRWLSQVRGEDEDSPANRLARWLRNVFLVMVVLLAFALGYGLGGRTEDQTPVKPGKDEPRFKEQRDHKEMMGRRHQKPAGLHACAPAGLSDDVA
jgi:hypothetical protein